MTDITPAPPPAPGSSAANELQDATEIWVPPPAAPKARRTKGWFDRIRLLLVMAAWFAFSLWRLRQAQPAFTFNDAVIEQLRNSVWLLALAGLESVRQIHYFISERSARYNTFWMDRVWGAIDRWKDRRDPWLRFRVARYTKWGFAYLVLSLFLSQRRGVSFFEGVAGLPGAIVNFLTTGPEQMPFWINILFPMFFIVGQFGLLFWFLSRGGVDVYMPEDVTTSFDDVWGQDQVLEKVRENIVFLEDPQSIEAKGGHVPGGLLLWGPPGTGKTLMAEAVAGQTGKPYVFVDPGAFINMFMGVGILKVKGLFRKLRKLSMRYGGVIVFFDEADSLGNRGSLAQGGVGGPPGPGMSGSVLGGEHLRWLSPETQAELFRIERQMNGSSDPDTPRSIKDRIIVGGGMGGGGMGTLQALLTEISGLKKPRGFLNRFGRRLLGLKPKPPIKYRILIMMATNLPEALDGALLRPGRLDRIYKVGYPSKEGRKKTYEGYLKKVRHKLSDEQIDKLSVITPYATGATIKDLVNEALINAIRDDRDAVTWQDIVRAKHFKELGPSEDVEYIERERHAIAVHEACHAVAAYRVRRHMNIDLATIDKGGNYLGMVSSIKPEDQFTRWRTEYEADIIVSLASLAGERLFFDGDNSSGVSGDLESATTIAALMEGFWGMGGTVSSHAVSRRLQIGGGGMPRPGDTDDKERDPLDGPLGARIELALERLLADAEQLLRDNYYEVLSVAHALETHKTLAGEDVEAVIDCTVGPLIDGRIYAGQEMKDELLAYHELAAAAHRQHGKVDAALPVAALGAGTTNGSAAGATGTEVRASSEDTDASGTDRSTPDPDNKS